MSQIQGKSVLLRGSGEIELPRVRVIGFNCTGETSGRGSFHAALQAKQLNLQAFTFSKLKGLLQMLKFGSCHDQRSAGFSYICEGITTNQRQNFDQSNQPQNFDQRLKD